MADTQSINSKGWPAMGHTQSYGIMETKSQIIMLAVLKLLGCLESLATTELKFNSLDLEGWPNGYGWLSG